MSKSIYSTEQRKAQANVIHDNKYDYSLWPDDVILKDRVNIICPIHGIFNQKVDKHIHEGNGCPKCAVERRKQTCLEKYGGSAPACSEKIRNKQKQTLLERYGVENSMQHTPFFQKKRQTMQREYGVEYSALSHEIKKKQKQTLLERYGVEHQSQIHISQQTLDNLNDKNWLIEQHHNLKKTLEQIAAEMGSTQSSISRYFHNHNIEIKRFYQSTGERQINEYISNLGILTIIRTRSVIPPYELDIFIPSHNIAIEYNGNYWHGNDFPETQKRDKIKRALCKRNGVFLVVVWDEDWAINSYQIKHSLEKMISQ